MAINPMDYGSKDVVLDVVRTERKKFFDVVDAPENWTVDTRCEGWQVRDMVGHMLDVTEGYLNAWDTARQGKEASPPLGLLVMAESLNEKALAFRSLSRDEAVNRLKNVSDKMLGIFDALSEDEWSNFNVPHTYMGPLPPLFYPAFHVMDYGVHTWDMHWGLGEKDAKLEARTAGVLVPYMFILMSATVDQKSAQGVNLTYGVKIDGEWGGQWQITLEEGQFKYEAVDDVSDLPAVFHYAHPSDFVLSTFQRIQGGETSGDPAVIEKVRGLFFRI